MRGFLLDINVVSELVKAVPEQRVIMFLMDNPDLWLSTIVLHEMDFGLNLLPPGNRRDNLSAALSGFVSKYDNRILQIDRPEAQQAAMLRGQARRFGRVLHLADALIAGTAKAHDLSVATRNAVDFEGLDVEAINPWESR